MTLEQAIHARWAADAALAARLPAERVTTGRTSGEAMPYATILRRSQRTVVRSNAGDTLDEVTLRIDVWHDDYDAGRGIADAVRRTFDGGDLFLDDRSRAVQIRRRSEAAVQHPDGVWEFALTVRVQVYTAGAGPQ